MPKQAQPVEKSSVWAQGTRRNLSAAPDGLASSASSSYAIPAASLAAPVSTVPHASLAAPVSTVAHVGAGLAAGILPSPASSSSATGRPQRGSSPSEARWPLLSHRHPLPRSNAASSAPSPRRSVGGMSGLQDMQGTAAPSRDEEPVFYMPRAAAEEHLRTATRGPRATREAVEAWVAKYDAPPLTLTPDQDGRITYLGLLTVKVSALAAALNTPSFAPEAAQSLESVAKAVETGSLVRAAWLTFQIADRDGNGVLTWNNGEVREFITAVCKQHSLPSPAEADIYRLYIAFDREKTMCLDACECLCLVDALARAVLYRNRALLLPKQSQASETVLSAGSEGKESVFAKRTAAKGRRSLWKVFVFWFHWAQESCKQRAKAATASEKLRAEARSLAAVELLKTWTLQSVGAQPCPSRARRLTAVSATLASGTRACVPVLAVCVLVIWRTALSLATSQANDDINIVRLVLLAWSNLAMAARNARTTKSLRSSIRSVSVAARVQDDRAVLRTVFQVWRMSVHCSRLATDVLRLGQEVTELREQVSIATTEAAKARHHAEAVIADAPALVKDVEAQWQQRFQELDVRRRKAAKWQARVRSTFQFWQEATLLSRAEKQFHWRLERAGQQGRRAIQRGAIAAWQSCCAASRREKVQSQIRCLHDAAHSKARKQAVTTVRSLLEGQDSSLAWGIIQAWRYIGVVARQETHHAFKLEFVRAEARKQATMTVRSLLEGQNSSFAWGIVQAWRYASFVAQQKKQHSWTLSHVRAEVIRSVSAVRGLATHFQAWKEVHRKSRLQAACDAKRTHLAAATTSELLLDKMFTFLTWRSSAESRRQHLRMKGELHRSRVRWEAEFRDAHIRSDCTRSTACKEKLLRCAEIMQSATHLAAATMESWKSFTRGARLAKVQQQLEVSCTWIMQLQTDKGTLESQLQALYGQVDSITDTLQTAVRAKAMAELREAYGLGCPTATSTLSTPQRGCAGSSSVSHMASPVPSTTSLHAGSCVVATSRFRGGTGSPSSTPRKQSWPFPPSFYVGPPDIGGRAAHMARHPQYDGLQDMGSSAVEALRHTKYDGPPDIGSSAADTLRRLNPPPTNSSIGVGVGSRRVSEVDRYVGGGAEGNHAFGEEGGGTGAAPPLATSWSQHFAVREAAPAMLSARCSAGSNGRSESGGECQQRSSTSSAVAPSVRGSSAPPAEHTRGGAPSLASVLQLRQPCDWDEALPYLLHSGRSYGDLHDS